MNDFDFEDSQVIKFKDITKEKREAVASLELGDRKFDLKVKLPLSKDRDLSFTVVIHGDKGEEVNGTYGINILNGKERIFKLQKGKNKISSNGTAEFQIKIGKKYEYLYKKKCFPGDAMDVEFGFKYNLKVASPFIFSPKADQFSLIQFSQTNFLEDEEDSTKTSKRSSRKIAKYFISSREKYGYVGLSNLGATCYLNSILQAIFCISRFRELIYQIDALKLRGIKSNKDNILLNLQYLFYQLQTSNTAVSPNALITSFGWNAEQLHQQQDVDDFFTQLFSNIEDKFKAHYPEFVQSLSDLF